MKKIFLLLSLGMLAVGMTACGRGDENADQSTEQSSSVSTESVETPSSEVVEDSTEESMPDAEEMPGEITWSEDMETLKQAVVDVLGENYWPNMKLDAEMLEMSFGITADMYDDYMAEIPMMSTHVDTLLIIKAKDDKVEAVEEALNAYRDMKVEDTMGYPMNVGKIQASRIQRYGNYVCFVQLGGEYLADVLSEEESITRCLEQNELALEVIGRKVPN